MADPTGSNQAQRVVGLIQRTAGPLADGSSCTLSDRSDILSPSGSEGVNKPLQILRALHAPTRGTPPAGPA
jgi:hypothetical protein